MSATSEPLPVPAKEASTLGESLSRWWARIEQWLLAASDRLNPILIKEARQALKSKQFTITFTLVLIAGWVWSILGLAMIGPGVYYSAEGPEMFYGYYLILAFPLIVIVPFGAFRSLSAEREDRTYELLSITNLRPRQIIGGKLASAVLQMIVYLSAVAPCLAFTYLLLGIDIVTIGLLLGYLVLGSIGLSIVGLLAATSTSEKYRQVVLMLALAIGLFYAFGGSCALGYELLRSGMPTDSSEFWQIHLALLTGYLSYCVLFFLAAASHLGFASSNRSTALRITIAAQFVLFSGWMTWAWLKYLHRELWLVYLSFAAVHWLVMGMFMTGESPFLSPRVKRDLPQSFLGRAFLTWFNPGPATGYMLAVSGLLAAVLFANGVLWLTRYLEVDSFGQFASNTTVVVSSPSYNPSPYNPSLPRGAMPTQPGLGLPPTVASNLKSYSEVVLRYSILLLSYFVIYLGIGRILLGLHQLSAAVGVLARILIHVLLIMLGAGVPWIIHLSIEELRRDGYTLVQITNLFWTLGEAGRPTLRANLSVPLVALPITAVLVFIANLPAVVREVRYVRITKPARVAEEDAALAALQAPPTPDRASPWD